MANQQDRDNYIGQIQTIANDLKDVDVSALGRRDDLSESINFEIAVPTLKNMFDFAIPFFDADVSRICADNLKHIFEALNDLNSYVITIQNYQIDGEKPKERCETIINDILNFYDVLMKKLSYPLLIISSQPLERDKELEAAKAARVEAESTVSEIQGILVEVKELSASAGVSANAKVFKSQSDLHRNLSYAWFAATALVFGGTLLFAVINYLSIEKYNPKTPGEAIHYISAKLIMLSIMMFALAWCSKNHKSHKHNQTLNKHRASALDTFQTFYNGSSDVEVKDTILLQAANTAFANRSTGYESTPETDNKSNSQFIEIVGKSVPQVLKSGQHTSS
ncbi:hypothetical protein FYZ48_11120 [Gimesia chilikensis]|uniref:hypothetical protein n=1 Tax=Gimesia chilikensis TaxID=2605989 RepID=UPI0011EEC041|nr:hypothetical protein [Gimesia chilikensis]KAA0139184.1 hypothetical protein FYZ48_11120 [Gimesia chilikensis]